MENKLQHYRTTSSFDAHKGKTHVEGRLHVELAASPEEAIAKTTAYLESWHYTNIKVTECHAETELEKYNKKFALWNGGGVDIAAGEDKFVVNELKQLPKAAPHKEKDAVAQVAAAHAAQVYSDDLF